jgi:FkbM family methyltransferase
MNFAITFYKRTYFILRYLFNKYVRRNNPAPLPIILSILVEFQSTIVDIGANVGEWIRVANTHSPWRANFICFEANPDLKLPEEYKMYPVDWRNHALGSKKSSMSLIVPENHRLGYLGSNKSQTENSRSVEVEVRLLDDIELSSIKKNVFMKIDVEGAEKIVLDGGKDFIKNKRPSIFIETYDDFAQRHDSTSKEVLTILEDLDYQIYWINTEDKLTKIVPSESKKIPGVFNKYIDFLAIPKEKMLKNFAVRTIIG